MEQNVFTKYNNFSLRGLSGFGSNGSHMTQLSKEKSKGGYCGSIEIKKFAQPKT